MSKRETPRIFKSDDDENEFPFRVYYTDENGAAEADFETLAEARDFVATLNR